VGADVLLQGPLCFERILAVRAFVRSLAGVDVQMLLQVGRTRELLATVGIETRVAHVCFGVFDSWTEFVFPFAFHLFHDEFGCVGSTQAHSAIIK